MSSSLKRSKSPKYFQSTKVDTCKYILSAKGNTVAIAYNSKKPENKSPTLWNSQSRSNEKQSHSSATYKIYPKMHVGMRAKPLVLYSPHSYRSRLPTPDFIAPYKNSSHFEIGDRTSCRSKSVFKTTNKALMTCKNILEGLTNQGIISEKTKWHKLRSLD